MGDKHRDLPSWMIGGDAKQSEQGELQKSAHKREKRKKTRHQRETLYFMNEAELVDAAFRVLTEGGGGNHGALAQQTEAEKNTPGWLVKTNGNFIKRKKTLTFESDTEGESSDGELRRKAYISETDPEDLPEKATLPGSPGLAGVSARGREPVLPSCSAGAASPGASDDEALRLVREIFFT